MRQQITDEGDGKKYFTQLPNIVFEIGLKPLELALYAHLKRAAGATGKCFKSTATLARETGMGTGTVSRTKTALEARWPALGNKPLIRTKEIPNPKGGKPFQEITITDIWKANTDRFSSSTVEVEAAETEEIQVAKPSSSVEIEVENQVPLEVEPSSKPTSTVEIKKNRKKKEEKKIGADAQPEIKPLSGIALLRDVAKTFPPKESWERYLEILGENPDEAKLRKCRAEWVDRGYNKVSWKWFTEWYVTNMPERNGQRPNAPTARTYEWQGRYYALGEVVSDDGERYTVMGADGTPSKRWHTDEAFAQDKGITLEQAKHGMGA